MSDQVEIDVKYVRSSERAILVEVLRPGTTVADRIWLPTSQITDQTDDDKGQPTSVFIPAWLAKEKNLL